MFRWFAPIVIAVATASPLVVRGAEQPVPKSPWTVDNVIMQERTSSWTLSDDGTQAVWIRHTPDREKDARRSTLMITNFAPNDIRALTVRKTGVSQPAFRPDGQAVSFLSAPPKTDGSSDTKKKKSGPQIWLLDLRGGEPRTLTDIPFGVGSYRWVDENTIILTTRERRSRQELNAEKDKDDTIVVEDRQRFDDTGRNLFRFDVDDKKLTRLAAGLGPVRMIEVSPDGRWAVALHDQSPSYRAEGDVPPRCLVHDLQAGTHHELLADRKNKPRQFRWRLDSQALYLVVPHSTVDGEPLASIHAVFEVSAPDWKTRPVELDWPRGLSFSLEPTDDGFLATLADGMRPKLARFRREVDGYQRDLVQPPGEGAVFSCVKARRASRVLYIQGTASQPDRLMTAKLAGSELTDVREVYRPNKGFADKPLAGTRRIRFQGALDEEVEALVYEPHGFEPGRKYPLVVMTHGGPHGADLDRFREDWSHSPNLYAQRGAFVLMVNYHGSSSYGLAFGESIKGRYYELEVKDIFAGIQTLVDEGVVDRERMGLVGWSNGAILSIAAVTLDHLYAPDYGFQFKACAPGAGDVNWSSDYGNCEFGPVFDDYYLGGPPWQLADLYRKKSPLYYVDRVHTPTIIFFGTKDRAVPTEQGWQWYRALSLVKQAPVRFLLFPDEPHGLQKLSHQKRKLAEELAWFDKYLFETAEPAESPIQDGSPLAVALEEKNFAADGGRYGVTIKGRLVPECVKVDDLEIGRFEVTRAQWQAYQPQTSVANGLHNHPQTGIDLKQAQAYIGWLRELTGEPWRLLRAAEFERIEKYAGGEENTLDWWAGYDPSPDDAAELGKQLESLPADSILLPVGSRPPGIHRRGDAQTMLFDIGGNAAELTITDDATARIVGGCAALASDDRAGKLAPPAEFVGLRVAKGKSSDGADDSAADAE